MTMFASRRAFLLLLVFATICLSKTSPSNSGKEASGDDAAHQDKTILSTKEPHDYHSTVASAAPKAKTILEKAEDSLGAGDGTAGLKEKESKVEHTHDSECACGEKFSEGGPLDDLLKDLLKDFLTGLTEISNKNAEKMDQKTTRFMDTSRFHFETQIRAWDDVNETLNVVVDSLKPHYLIWVQSFVSFFSLFVNFVAAVYYYGEIRAKKVKSDESEILFDKCRKRLQQISAAMNLESRTNEFLNDLVLPMPKEADRFSIIADCLKLVATMLPEGQNELKGTKEEINEGAGIDDGSIRNLHPSSSEEETSLLEKGYHEKTL